MKEPIKQNASGLNPFIQTIGCFFRAAARMAEYVAEAEKLEKQFLTKGELNSLWDLSKNKGYINDDNDVMQSVGIANAALSILKVRGKFVEVATFRNGQMNWYQSIPKAERKADFFIQKIEQNGPNQTHFINVDKYGVLIWDPHNPGIKKRKTFYTICYRFDKEKENETI